MNREERSIVGVTMLGHAMVHVFELSIPVLVPIWIREFSVTPATIGFAVAAGYALFGFGALPAGVLSDRFGADRLIQVCALGMSAAFFVLSVSSSLVGVTAALLLWGAAASLYHPAGLSLISTRVNKRGTALGYHGMAGNVGIALGPLATMLLLLTLDWRVTTAVLAVPAVLTAVVVSRLSLGGGPAEPTPDGGDSDAAAGPSSILADSRTLFASGFALVFLLYICEGLYYRGVLTFLPGLLDGFAALDPVSLGGTSLNPSRYVYAGLLLVGVVGQYASGRLADRIPVEYGVVGVFAALGVIALAFVPAAEAGLVPLLVVSAFLGTFLFGLQPFLQSSVAEYSPADVRGLSYGFVYAGLFGVGASGAAITGVILTYAGPPMLFLALAGFAAVAVVIALVLQGGSRP